MLCSTDIIEVCMLLVTTYNYVYESDRKEFSNC